MPLVHAPRPPKPAAKPMTLRSASLVFTDGPMRKVTASALWVKPKRGGIVVCLGKPWAMLRSEQEPTVEDFMRAFEERRFSADQGQDDGGDRVARYDGSRFYFDTAMSPRRRSTLGKLMLAAHTSLTSAHQAGEAWPLPSVERWTPWLLAQDDAVQGNDGADR